MYGPKPDGRKDKKDAPLGYSQIFEPLRQKEYELVESGYYESDYSDVSSRLAKHYKRIDDKGLKNKLANDSANKKRNEKCM